MDQPEIITKPICYAGAPNVDYITPPNDTQLPQVSQAKGYPIEQQQPLSSGGEPVNRAQTNGLWHFISAMVSFMNKGGFVTFSNKMIEEGGYDQNVILWCESNKSLQLSLKDNNVANFNENHAYINDGVNWQTLFQTAGNYVINGQADGMATNQLYAGLALDGSSLKVTMDVAGNKVSLGNLPTQAKPSTFPQINTANTFTQTQQIKVNGGLYNLELYNENDKGFEFFSYFPSNNSSIIRSTAGGQDFVQLDFFPSSKQIIYKGAELANKNDILNATTTGSNNYGLWIKSNKWLIMWGYLPSQSSRSGSAYYPLGGLIQAGNYALQITINSFVANANISIKEEFNDHFEYNVNGSINGASWFVIGQLV